MTEARLHVKSRNYSFFFLLFTMCIFMDMFRNLHIYYTMVWDKLLGILKIGGQEYRNNGNPLI